MVHGRVDAYCSPEQAAATFERVGEPKEFLWLDTAKHIDLYDNEPFVTAAVERITAWFEAYL